jgi:hypothetical protein
VNDDKVIALIGKTRAAMEEVEKRLDDALLEIKMWETHPEMPLTPEQIQAHKDNTIMAYGRLRVLQGEYERLIDFMQRAIKQRQSAKEAYHQGWDARLNDLLARLDTQDDAQVRRILIELDASDTLPF